ncbi:hypothetical protein GIB67_028605 [Kingdonia uniflora]|uniref:Amine oxidase domain-containing protein n=1 Tax=Kingdonia uniflora TaxID=39325 RepID=A0A7J7KZH1_9MAGN|nr:hypothetical protein GIB67_028605 [Kingdonia uniflora]
MPRMRVAVVGAGINGLVSAYILAKEGVDVVLYEKEDYLGGGHAWTVNIEGVDIDLGSMVMRVTCPNMMEFFDSLGVETERTDISVAVSLDKGRSCEWGTRNGLSSLFAQKRNLLNPYFYQMIREILKFKDVVIKFVEDLESNSDIHSNETLEHFVKSHGYSELFQKAYLLPLCALIWSCPSEDVLSFSAFSVFLFFRNHQLLQIFGHPQWLTKRQGSHSYVHKVREELESKGCNIRTGCVVQSITTYNGGCTVSAADGSQEMFNACIVGVHARDALTILGKQASSEETRILGAFQYVKSDAYLHHDKSLMPQNPTTWSAWNFVGTTDKKVCLTYWLNVLQVITRFLLLKCITETELPLLVTLNPPIKPENTLLIWSTSHPFPSVTASKASLELNAIQGKRGIWFCGAYQDQLYYGLTLICGSGTGRYGCGTQCSWENMFSFEKHKTYGTIINKTGARLFVTRFLKSFITMGSLTLLEEGGTVISFGGINEKTRVKSVVNVHNPQFYSKVATQADLGFAEAYIDGDISFVDKNILENFFEIFIINRESHTAAKKRYDKRGWWTPLLLTAGYGSAKYFLRHVLRKNTLSQARKNISLHYDLSNDLFKLFLDETMTYSTANFKAENEDLKIGQLRKISTLIQKARVEKYHEILEIGCGWGGLAIEVVKQTGCRYTGVILSREQLTYSEQKVKEAGLQDNITFILCDYRQLPLNKKYDRIISNEMVEAVGHEYMEEYFSCCDAALAENGLLVLQFTSMPDERYEEYRRSSEFINVEHCENIGGHYYQTLKYWRDNLLKNQSKIMELGFDKNFIRTFEYYFNIVFSRPGNVATLDNPYKQVPFIFDNSQFEGARQLSHQR